VSSLKLKGWEAYKGYHYILHSQKPSIEAFGPCILKNKENKVDMNAIVSYVFINKLSAD
jgi:hypothetical protein